VQVEGILEGSALAMAPGCAKVAEPGTSTPVEQCWTAEATGHGIVTANAALAATP
jgi:hypothetical protein